MNIHRKTYWRLYYHLIWRTKKNEPLIQAKTKEHLLHYIRLKCAELECLVIALNAVEDHVHLLCSIPPKLAVAEFVQRIKGSSSHHINQELRLEVGLEWQRGYGALTVSPNHVKRIAEYVEHQEARHQTGQLIEALEQTEEEEE